MRSPAKIILLILLICSISLTIFLTSRSAADIALINVQGGSSGRFTRPVLEKIRIQNDGSLVMSFDRYGVKSERRFAQLSADKINKLKSAAADISSDAPKNLDRKGFCFDGTPQSYSLFKGSDAYEVYVINCQNESVRFGLPTSALEILKECFDLANRSEKWTNDFR